MKKDELVWRELVDAFISSEERRWDNLDDLAFRSGVAPATAAYALRRQIEVGAIRQHHAGFTVVNPAKALTSLCAARSVISDALSGVSRQRAARLHSGFADAVWDHRRRHRGVAGFGISTGASREVPQQT